MLFSWNTLNISNCLKWLNAGVSCSLICSQHSSGQQGMVNAVIFTYKRFCISLETEMWKIFVIFSIHSPLLLLLSFPVYPSNDLAEARNWPTKLLQLLSPSCLSSYFCNTITWCYLRLSFASCPPYPCGLICLLIILINICFPPGTKHCPNILLSAIIPASILFETLALTLQLLSLCVSNLVPAGMNTCCAVPYLFMGILLYADSLPENPQQIKEPKTVYHIRFYGIQASFSDFCPDLHQLVKV